MKCGKEFQAVGWSHVPDDIGFTVDAVCERAAGHEGVHSTHPEEGSIPAPDASPTWSGGERTKEQMMADWQVLIKITVKTDDVAEIDDAAAAQLAWDAIEVEGGDAVEVLRAETNVVELKEADDA